MPINIDELLPNANEIRKQSALKEAELLEQRYEVLVHALNLSQKRVGKTRPCNTDTYFVPAIDPTLIQINGCCTTLSITLAAHLHLRWSTT